MAAPNSLSVFLPEGPAAGQCLARLRELFLAAVAWLKNDLFGLGVDLEHSRKLERHLTSDQENQRSVRLDLDDIRTHVAEMERTITGGRGDPDADGVHLSHPGPLMSDGRTNVGRSVPREELYSSSQRVAHKLVSAVVARLLGREA